MSERHGESNKSSRWLFRMLRASVLSLATGGAGVLPVDAQVDISPPGAEQKEHVLLPRTSQEEMVYQQALASLGQLSLDDPSAKDHFTGILLDVLGKKSLRVFLDVFEYTLQKPDLSEKFSSSLAYWIPNFYALPEHAMRLPDIVFRISKLKGEQFILNNVYERALEGEPWPWLTQLLERAATEFTRDEFLETFGKVVIGEGYAGYAFAARTPKDQEILRPILEKHYQTPPIQELFSEWQRIARLEKDAPQRGSTYYRFVDETLGNIYSSEERLALVEMIVPSLSLSTDSNDPVLLFQRSSWWADNSPRSDAVLKSLLDYIVQHGRPEALYYFEPATGLRKLRHTKPWIEEIDRGAGEREPRLVFEFFTDFETYAWSADFLQEHAAGEADEALRNYGHYVHLPNALEIVRRALPHADGLLGLAILDMIQNIAPEERRALTNLLPQNIAFETALLASNDNPNPKRLREDLALVHVAEVDRTLVFPLVKRTSVDDRWWNELQKRFEEIDKGEEIKTTTVRMRLLRDLARTYGGRNPLEVEGLAAAVALNLAEQEKEISETTVRAEVRQMEEDRKEHSAEPIYDAHILLLSHEETMRVDTGIRKKGDPRFGTPEYEALIRARQAEQKTSDRSFVHISPRLWETPQSAKERALEILANPTSLDPLLLIFDGHGGPDALYLSDGQVLGVTEQRSDLELDDEKRQQLILETERTRKITVDDMVAALGKRFEKLREMDPTIQRLNLTFVLGACFTEDFVRAVAAKLKAQGVPGPDSAVVAAEKGQYGFSNFEEPTGSLFNRLMVADPATLGSVLDNQYNDQDSNPGVFRMTRRGFMQLGGDIQTSSPEVTFA